MHRYLILTFFISTLVGASSSDFLIQPPNAPSGDIYTFRRQLLFHNGNRILERLKQNDANLNRTITTIEDSAKLAPPPITASNFKLMTGTQLDKGIVYTEIFWYAPTLRSELNLIKQNTIIRLSEGPISATYSTPFNNTYHFNLVFNTTFE